MGHIFETPNPEYMLLVQYIYIYMFITDTYSNTNILTLVCVHENWFKTNVRWEPAGQTCHSPAELNSGCLCSASPLCSAPMALTNSPFRKLQPCKFRYRTAHTVHTRTHNTSARKNRRNVRHFRKHTEGKASSRKTSGHQTSLWSPDCGVIETKSHKFTCFNTNRRHYSDDSVLWLPLTEKTLP